MDKQYRVDLHTHSILSRDGGITKTQYVKILDKGVLDFVAITDHGEVGFAKALQKELGAKIIVGEEIATREGEIIGLFLDEKIEPRLSVLDTVAKIKAQGGLVYIPHPFETFRSGLQEEALNTIIDDIDIVEVFNARGALRGRAEKAEEFTDENKLAKASSSDAHCRIGISSAFSLVSDMPDNKSLVGLLRKGEFVKNYAPVISYLCPSFNKIKNKLVL